MKINKIIIENFRNYKNNTISFENLKTIFIAENGQGKSTLRTAILLGMYGLQYVKEQELVKYPQDDMSYWNRYVGISKPIRIHIEFELENNSKLTVDRIIEKGQSEKCDYILDDKNDAFRSKHITPAVFEEYFPRHLALFSFVDGERIKNIETAVTSGDKKELKNEIYEVLNINELEEKGKIITKATHTLVGQISASNFKETLIDQLDEKIISREHENEKLQLEYDNNVNEIENIEEQIGKLETILYSTKETDSIKEKRDIANSKHDVVEQNIKSKSENVVSDFFTNYEVMFEKFCNQNINFDSIESQIIPDLTKDSLNYIQQNKICICGEKIDENKNLILEDLKQYLPPANISSMLSLQVEAINSKYDDQNAAMNLKLDEIKLLRNNQRLLGEEIEEYNRVLKLYSDGTKNTAEIYEEVSNCKDRRDAFIERNKSILTFISQNEISNDEDIKERDKLFAGIGSKEDKEIYDQLKLAKYELDDKISHLKEHVQESLQSKINVFVNRIMDSEVTVTIDKYFLPIVKNGYNVEMDSSGQQVVASICYIFALIDVLKELSESHSEIIDMKVEPFPLILDTITAPLDKGKANRLINELNNYNGQIVFVLNDAQYIAIKESTSEMDKFVLIHNEELSEVEVRRYNEQ